jgi:5-methylcytosine-specific restriction endonuclease McrA
VRYKIQQNKKPELLNGAHGTYGALLFDKRWREKRVNILERDKNTCRVCNDGENLEVHHRQYHFLNKLRTFKKPWEYSDELLVTLCKRCHQKGHQLYTVPIKYI